MDYSTVCKYVGQLFLESRHELQQRIEHEASLKAEIDRLQKERDKALEMLKSLPERE